MLSQQQFFRACVDNSLSRNGFKDFRQRHPEQLLVTRWPPVSASTRHGHAIAEAEQIPPVLKWICQNNHADFLNDLLVMFGTKLQLSQCNNFALRHAIQNLSFDVATVLLENKAAPLQEINSALLSVLLCESEKSRRSAIICRFLEAVLIPQTVSEDAPAGLRAVSTVQTRGMFINVCTDTHFDLFKFFVRDRLYGDLASLKQVLGEQLEYLDHVMKTKLLRWCALHLAGVDAAALEREFPTLPAHAILDGCAQVDAYRNLPVLEKLTELHVTDLALRKQALLSSTFRQLASHLPMAIQSLDDIHRTLEAESTATLRRSARI